MVVMTLMGYFCNSSSIVVYSDELIIFLLYTCILYEIKCHIDGMWIEGNSGSRPHK